jgi:hypothetical protein
LHSLPMRIRCLCIGSQSCAKCAQDI